MDDPQVTQAHLAWLAGVWDGEGSISFKRATFDGKKGQKYHQFSPKVTMVNTNTAILQEVMRILKVLDIHHYFREKGQGGFEGSSKQCWLIAIERLSECAKILTAIRPFLIGKAFQADCLLSFVNSRLSRNFPRKGFKRDDHSLYRYSAEELEYLNRILDANGHIHKARGTSEAIRQALVER